MTYDPAFTDPAQPAPKKLNRSDDRWIAGVCAGLGEYFGLDAALVRVLFVASCLLPGPQFLLYVILWIVMPARKPVY